MNKKLLTIMSTSALSAVVLSAGAFALFHDSKTTAPENVNVGTVDAEITKAQIDHYQIMPDFLAYANISKKLQNLIGGKKTYVNAAGAPSEKPDMFTQAPDNLNPGDNDKSVYPDVVVDYSQYLTEITPGIDHELTVGIKNKGTKSIETRLLIEMTGTTKEGTPISAEDLKNISLAFDPNHSDSGTSACLGMSSRFLNLPSTPEENKITFKFDPNDKKLNLKDFQTNMNWFYPLEATSPHSDIIYSAMVLSGVSSKTGDSVELEKYPSFSFGKLENGVIADPKKTEKTAPTEGTVVLDIVVNKDMKEDLFQGATINFKIVLEGLQYRNTGADTWKELDSQKAEIHP